MGDDHHFVVLNRIPWVVPFIEFHGWSLLFFQLLPEKNSNDELQIISFAMKAEQYRISDTASV